ncbi:MAG: hypothetical protein ACLS9F_10595 [Clostridium paraputrificum]
MNIEANEELDRYYSAIGFDYAEKGNHLGLLTSDEERRFFNFLTETIPNISNVDIISICNLATMMATFKKLGEYIDKVDSNVELYLKLVSKRNDTISKIDKLLSSCGLTGTSRSKLKIIYDLTEDEDGKENS